MNKVTKAGGKKGRRNINFEVTSQDLWKSSYLNSNLQVIMEDIDKQKKKEKNTGVVER